jgi:hypothetical protein
MAFVRQIIQRNCLWRLPKIPEQGYVLTALRGAAHSQRWVGRSRPEPESYLMTAHVVQHRFRHMPLWRHLDCCFPFQVLSLEAPVVEFYDFYGV